MVNTEKIHGKMLLASESGNDLEVGDIVKVWYSYLSVAEDYHLYRIVKLTKCFVMYEHVDQRFANYGQPAVLKKKKSKFQYAR